MLQYSKPQVTSSMDAVATIHQQSWTSHTVNGIAKTANVYHDSQPTPSLCTAGAYEADE